MATQIRERAPISTLNPREEITAPADGDLHELLTVDEVAAILKVSRTWVYEHTRSRGTARAERLAYIKIGKYKRFDLRSLREFLLRRAKSA
jgi:Helix-turn-helix domain